MNEKKEQKGKKTLLACVAVALVCAISVGTTLALSKATAKPISNTFTTPEISLMLTEPDWDGDKDGDGNVDSDVDETSTLGMTLAEKYYNGLVIPKDPKLTNTSAYDEYVAIKLKFYVWGTDGAGKEDNDYTEVTQAQFKSKVADFTVKTGWEYDADDDVYYYKSASAFTKLPKNGGVTANLFDNVTIVATDTGEIKAGETVKVSWKKLPKFEIDITGYAVQADNLKADKSEDVTTIKTELKALMNNKGGKE